MSTLVFHTLDVFTETAYTGNPLAVVLDADALGTAQMQRIAREFALSETVFVRAPRTPGAVATARIFTPERELPFAGHPTVGTACLLAELGLAPAGDDIRFVLDEGVGPVAVEVRRAAGRASFAQLTSAVPPEVRPWDGAVEQLAAVLGLEPADLVSEGEVPRQASCGNPFVLVPVRQPELLPAIAFDSARAKSLLAGAWGHALYVYARGYEGDLRARMFATDLGISEDPATGSAAVALAGALALEAPEADADWQWPIHQGVEMGRASLLHAEASKRGGRVIAVRVGGHAVRVSEGRIRVPA
ncbi:MAG: PhzF family phenazine biosynthesis protein [Stagnimonas sp.]|nr:PhzF family phenazine biosynthesis protein [Stagnimonas sp.]